MSYSYLPNVGNDQYYYPTTEYYLPPNRLAPYDFTYNQGQQTAPYSYGFQGGAAAQEDRKWQSGQYRQWYEQATSNSQQTTAYKGNSAAASAPTQSYGSAPLPAAKPYATPAPQPQKTPMASGTSNPPFIPSKEFVDTISSCNHPYLFKHAEAAFRKGDFQNALNHISCAVNISPQNSYVDLEGRIYISLKDYFLALRSFCKSTTRPPLQNFHLFFKICGQQMIITDPNLKSKTVDDIQMGLTSYTNLYCKSDSALTRQVFQEFEAYKRSWLAPPLPTHSAAGAAATPPQQLGAETTAASCTMATVPATGQETQANGMGAAAATPTAAPTETLSRSGRSVMDIDSEASA